MRKREFTSIFATEMGQYLDDRISLGFKETSYLSVLRVFDRFCSSQALSAPVFTREMAERWVKLRNEEAPKTRAGRVNIVKNFLLYLLRKGYDVHVPRDIVRKTSQSKPHIYSEDEIERYFAAVDSIDSQNRKIRVQLPLLFRILYCCGTRINETLGLRKKDIDLDAGILKLVETKNSRERYVVLGDDLAMMMRQFAIKTFYLLDNDDYIFTSKFNRRYDHKSIYKYHQLILRQAGIPFVGGGKGPRLQDWRFTFAAHAFKRMAESGMDMYVALPILSAYLGHQSIYSTEHYIRLTMSTFPHIELKFSTVVERILGEQNHENY